MAADLFTFDLRERFRRGDTVVRLLYLNIGVFVIVSLVNLVLMLFRWPTAYWTNCLELPANLQQLARQPWSLITYMFMHAGLLHLVFNMLWLFWFGKLFLQFFSSRHLRGLYLLGGICGGLLYLLAFNVFPYFSDAVYLSYLLGASASVLAIVFAVGLSQPDLEVQFLLIGRVRLKYVALAVFLLDLFFITSDNGGGHIAHLGGALAGCWFVTGLRKGYDVTRWINAVFDAVGKLFVRTPRRPKMTVHFSDRTKDYEYNARKKERNEAIDRILDKLRQSGYNSLTDDEKRQLFDASKK